jgi:cellulose synthase/poly-beta-1,6-N-acetylglucosamine synthase-like glycosyltransferase
MLWLTAILILPYVILLLKIYRSLSRTKSFRVSVSPSVFVSVVVACRNEHDNIPSLLNNIALQSYPENLFELIIVDDGSADRTYDIVSEFKAIKNIKILKNEGMGKKQALRTGIGSAEGNLIITTDADCSMGREWIRTIAAYFEENRPDMIICPVQFDSLSGFFGKFQELEFLSLQGITAGCALSGEATMCNGANLAFTRNAYLDNSNNLLDEINTGDDIFLLHSMKRRTVSKILWLESADAMVKTKPSLSINSFLKQRSRWISKAKTYKDRPTIVLGMITFTAVILQILSLVASLIYYPLICVFLLIIIMKSIPDYLILKNTSRRYGKSKIMGWFLPSQLIYPFYVIAVVFYTLMFRDSYSSNSPSPKET